ncbi:hypothetical protein, partial [Hydrogenophaga intermedia]|uniref:hypothetical protein n=1 Tax=Hydrogenophaga intermedia TaxID=65786 RepID=UPI0020440FA6
SPDTEDTRPQFLRDFFPRRPIQPQPPRHITTARHRKGSPAARLEGLLRTLGQAQEGQRNTVLRWTACRVGEMLAGGELPDAWRAAAALEIVATSIGLTPREARATIRSGFTTYGVSE